jgi:hypothetical protein
MKKLFFAAAAIAVLGLSSCAKKCVDCSSVAGYGSTKICEEDYAGVGGVTWETYKAALKAAGCKDA